MKNGTVWRHAISGVIGAAVALLGGTVTGLVHFGEDRETVRQMRHHIDSTEPVRTEAVAHMRDQSAHLDPTEASVLAAVPVHIANMNSRLERVERKLDEILRAVK